MTESKQQADDFRFRLTPADYQEMAESVPLRALEWPSLQARLGDLRHCSVLDVACGTGMNTRRFKLWGAERVLGIDLSSEVIQFAREQEEASPLGVEYAVADVRNLAQFGTFDRISASFVIQLARDRQELEAMLRAICDALKPGGLFIASLPNPHTPPNPVTSREMYGYVLHRAEGDAADFVTIHAKLTSGKASMAYDYYWTPWRTYEEILQELEFSSYRKQPYVLPEELERARPEGFWDEYFVSPDVIQVICRK